MRETGCKGVRWPMKAPRAAVAALAAAGAGVTAAGDVILPAIYGDHMVLQQRRPVPIRGWAAPGEAVRVTASWDRAGVQAQAGPEGRWQVALPTPGAGGPHEITVAGRNTITLRDVMVGEVWLCSGQSNMEWPVSDSNGAESEIAAAGRPSIRLFTVENRHSAMERSDCRGAWAVCSPQTAASFGAVGYFFGRDLQDHLGVPVGLIGADWGGSVIEAWMSRESLERFPEFSEALTTLAALGDPATRGSRPEDASVDRNAPSALFNGMIAPLAPFEIAGAIWYQGESNRPRPRQYAALFPALIRDWRTRFGGELPFYYVQIAPFAYGNDAGEAALLREAQAEAMALPGTGMVATLDIGDRQDIHPRNKKEVGRRLALWARARTYGEKDLIYCGPLYSAMRVEGPAVRLFFDHAGGRLELRPARRGLFLVAGPDRQFHVADAHVEGGSVVVSSPRVAAPVAVRYAWDAAPQASLFGPGGLPAAPFRTDRWDEPLPPPGNDSDMEACRTREPGFTPLFNGRDLTGWVNVNGAESTWRAAGGVLACSGVPTGVLRTDRQYENFVLELEWRHLRAGGNAGVFVWSDPLPARGQPFTRSIEVQVLDGAEGSWFTSDGDVFPIHGAAMTPHNGRGGSRAFPTEARSNPSPLWNHYRIECRDGAIALAVNGAVVTRGRECSPRRGYICLESEGSPVEFRNLRIRELPASLAPGSPVTAAEAEPFVPLYNGVDFCGWALRPEHEGHWKAQDWRLSFDGQGTDLWTERSYGDFVLICDWRWTAEPRQTDRPVILPSGEYRTGPDGRPVTATVPDAGDSGVYLRGSSRSQVNIWCWPVGSGEVYGYRTDPDMPPEVRSAVTPRLAADAPIGQWNRFRITMRGEMLTVVLNDRTVIEDARLPGVAASGPIGLQQHGSPIEFANLYIRELR